MPEAEQTQGATIVVAGGQSLPFDQSKASALLGIGNVWAIESNYADAAISALSALPIADCLRFQREAREAERNIEIEAAARRASGDPEDKPYRMIGSTALLEVRGAMTKKSSSWGGASTNRLSAQLQAAEKDKDVDRVLMIFETPGGECRGCAEFADQIRATNTVKPVYGYLEDGCYSAGYFGASQCEALFMNRMGLTGCIGTLSVIGDYSASMAQRGIKIYKFTSDGAGEYKGAGAYGTEITATHQAEYQRLVNHYGGDFKATVQLGRGLSDEQVAAVATGQEFTAEQAMALGLIDGICSLEECLNTISGAAPAKGATSAKPAATTGAKPQGENMAETTKPSLGARVLAALKGEGIDVDAAGGGESQNDHPNAGKPETHPIDVKAILADQVKAQETAADLLIQATCAHLDPAGMDGFKALAKAALAVDGGVPGVAVAGFRTLAKASVQKVDMTQSQFVQIAGQMPKDLKDKLEAESKRVLAGARSAMNGGS